MCCVYLAQSATDECICNGRITVSCEMICFIFWIWKNFKKTKKKLYGNSLFTFFHFDKSFHFLKFFSHLFLFIQFLRSNFYDFSPFFVSLSYHLLLRINCLHFLDLFHIYSIFEWISIFSLPKLDNSHFHSWANQQISASVACRRIQKLFCWLFEFDEWICRIESNVTKSGSNTIWNSIIWNCCQFAPVTILQKHNVYARILFENHGFRSRWQ